MWPEPIKSLSFQRFVASWRISGDAPDGLWVVLNARRYHPAVHPIALSTAPEKVEQVRKVMVWFTVMRRSLILVAGQASGWLGCRLPRTVAGSIFGCAPYLAWAQVVFR